MSASTSIYSYNAQIGISSSYGIALACPGGEGHVEYSDTGNIIRFNFLDLIGQLAY